MKKICLIAMFCILMSVAYGFASDDPVVAVIGNRKMLMSDLNRMISYQGAEKQKVLEQNQVFKATVLQRIVQSIVISKIAKAKGFDNNEAVKEYLRIVTDDLIASEYLSKEIVDKIVVTESDIRLYYQTYPADFKVPEMVRARHILFKVDKSASEEAMKKAKLLAERTLVKIKAGEDFARLATEISEDPASKIKGGDLGFFAKGVMVPDFENAAFTLKPGEVSGIIESAFGFHIVKVEERKDSGIEPYEKAKDKVKEKVFNEFKKVRIEEFVEKAMKDAGVELKLDQFLPKN